MSGYGCRWMDGWTYGYWHFELDAMKVFRRYPWSRVSLCEHRRCCLHSLACRLQLQRDGTRWRTGGEVKRKLANGVGSQYSSHYLGTWNYRCCTHLGCQQSTELTPPADLNGLIRFAERRNLVCARVPSHFNRPLLLKMFSLLQCIIHVKRVFSYTVKQVCDSQLNVVMKNVLIYIVLFTES